MTNQTLIQIMRFTAPASDLKPAFVVVDLATGEAQRMLEGFAAFMPSDEDVVNGDQLVGFTDSEGNPQPWHLPMNAISIAPAFDYVYVGTMNGRDIPRIPTSALADAKR